MRPLVPKMNFKNFKFFLITIFCIFLGFLFLFNNANFNSSLLPFSKSIAKSYGHIEYEKNIGLNSGAFLVKNARCLNNTLYLELEVSDDEFGDYIIKIESDMLTIYRGVKINNAATLLTLQLPISISEIDNIEFRNIRNCSDIFKYSKKIYCR